MSDLTKPIEITDFVSALRDLTPQRLEMVTKSLKTSIANLRKSDELMQKLIDHDPMKEKEYGITTAEDTKLYEESIIDNKKVLDNQELRIVAVYMELKRRGLPYEDNDNAQENPNSIVL